MSRQDALPDLNAMAATADETVTDLLEDALAFLQGIVERNDLEKLPASHAILTACFGVLKQREMHYEEQRADRLAAQTGNDQDGTSDEQRQRDYDWLKCQYETANPKASESEHLEAIARIVRLTGV